MAEEDYGLQLLVLPPKRRQLIVASRVPFRRLNWLAIYDILQELPSRGV